MSNRTRFQRLQVALDLINKMKNDTGLRHVYNDQFPAIQQLKLVFKEYINQDENNLLSYSGKIKFAEIGMTIEYKLPIKTIHDPLFVFRRK